MHRRFFVYLMLHGVPSHTTTSLFCHNYTWTDSLWNRRKGSQAIYVPSPPASEKSVAPGRLQRGSRDSSGVPGESLNFLHIHRFNFACHLAPPFLVFSMNAATFAC